MLGAFAGPTIPDWLAPAYADGLAGICLYGNNLRPTSGPRRPGPRRARRSIRPPCSRSTRRAATSPDSTCATAAPTPATPPSASTTTSQATRAIAAAIGAELARAGVWLNLAPSADINSDPRNPVIGTRSFGADPALVARHTVGVRRRARIAGRRRLRQALPGPRRHRDRLAPRPPPRQRSRPRSLRARELVPFAANLDAAASIMTSHVRARGVRRPGNPRRSAAPC